MKIKIIDLFVKIANREQVPEKIKYKNEIYKRYQNVNANNLYYYQVPNKDKFLIKQISSAIDLLDEVEIIEEPKKIEKLPYYSLEKIQKSKSKDKWYENRLELLEKQINDYHNKINELIDEINNLKEK